MTAIVTPLPGLTRLVAVPSITRAQRMRNLTWLADAVIAAPHEWPLMIISDVLALYAAHGLTSQQRSEAFAEYLGERRAEMDARRGLMALADLVSTRPGASREPAQAIARQNAACALADLAGRDSGAPPVVHSPPPVMGGYMPCCSRERRPEDQVDIDFSRVTCRAWSDR